MVVSTSRGATRPTTLAAAASDRAAERRARRRHPTTASSTGSTTCSTATGFTYDRVGHLWLVDVATGEAPRLTDGRAADDEPAWSPDGRRIAFASNRRRDADLLATRLDIHVVDVETRAVTAVTRGPRSMFSAPTWLPDGRTIAALGHRLEGRAGSRNDIWLFAADGSDATPTGGRNLSARARPDARRRHDQRRDARRECRGSSAVAGRPLASRSAPRSTAPTSCGGSPSPTAALERLTEGRHYISGWDASRGRAVACRIAYLRSTPTEPPDLWLLEPGTVAIEAAPPDRVQRRGPRRARAARTASSATRRSTAATSRAGSSPAGDGPRPLVVEIHGGPHTLYGWSPLWEFQVLAAAGIGVFYCNPRGSEGYGQAFNDANHRDWGHGPMRDVLAGRGRRSSPTAWPTRIASASPAARTAAT